MNQRGSISYLVLAPLIVVILTTLAATITTLVAFQQKQKTCRKIALSAQEIQSAALAKILSLNTEAKSLRAQEVSLKTSITAAAAIPYGQGALPNLYTALRIVQGAQKSLDFQQRSILFTANVRATSVASSKSPLIPAKKIQLRVHAKSKNAAPEYELDANFEKAQTVNFKYKLILKDVLPGWLLKLFVNVGDVKMECSSTIKKKENKWLPVLNAVNLF